MQNKTPESFTLAGRPVWLWQPPKAQGPSDAPLVLWPGKGNAPRQMTQALSDVWQRVEAGVCRPFYLACFASEDWNRDYSPWPAPAVFKNDGAFLGGGTETLEWMRSDLLPTLAQKAGRTFAQDKTSIIGYSLAGLFALWVFYESGLFSAAASCSGSLWYDGWESYMAKKQAPAGSRVYLSLGDREEMARNPRMAAVGAATRRIAAQLAADPNVAETVLEWEPGGHFDGAEKRLAKGLEWLVRL